MKSTARSLLVSKKVSSAPLTQWSTGFHAWFSLLVDLETVFWLEKTQDKILGFNKWATILFWLWEGQDFTEEKVCSANTIVSVKFQCECRVWRWGSPSRQWLLHLLPLYLCNVILFFFNGGWRCGERAVHKMLSIWKVRTSLSLPCYSVWPKRWIKNNALNLASSRPEVWVILTVLQYLEITVRLNLFSLALMADHFICVYCVFITRRKNTEF